MSPKHTGRGQIIAIKGDFKTFVIVTHAQDILLVQRNTQHFSVWQQHDGVHYLLPLVRSCKAVALYQASIAVNYALEILLMEIGNHQ